LLHSFLCQRPFLARVEFGALDGQSTALQARKLILEGFLNGLTPIRKHMLVDEFIQLGQQLAVKRHGDFGCGHALPPCSMMIYHTMICRPCRVACKDYALIMLMFVPRAGGLMALDELMAFLKLRNSHLGLILLYPSAVSVALFIMRQSFLVGTTDVHSSYGAESAAYTVAMLPAIIVFVLMQRWFGRGLSEGILKL
jgi:hypothetical protein